MGKSPLEGWRFLPEDTSTATAYQSQTFEGLYEWQFHTLAYAENEWAGVTPWNAPSSAILAPGETRTYGLQFKRVAAAATDLGQEGPRRYTAQQMTEHGAKVYTYVFNVLVRLHTLCRTLFANRHADVYPRSTASLGRSARSTSKKSHSCSTTPKALAT